MLRNRCLPRYLSASLMALLPATPALASGGSVQLPEPSALVLFALGVAGVAIGRKFSTKRPRD